MVRARGGLRAGFTLIELMITVAVVGLLASIAIGQYHDYVRRAKLSEVLLAISACKIAVNEGYLAMNQPPQPGRWGCESGPSSAYAGAIQTSADGAIRIVVANLDPAVDGQHVYLVPLRATGAPMRTSGDLGQRVHNWLCGSDFDLLRRSLPATCRADTSAQAGAEFE